MLPWQPYTHLSAPSGASLLALQQLLHFRRLFSAVHVWHNDGLSVQIHKICIIVFPFFTLALVSDVLCFDFCSLIAVSVWVSVFGLHDHDACVWYKGGIYSECACVLGRYIAYGQGGCMYSECMYVLGVEKIVYGQNFVSAFQSLFLCNTEIVMQLWHSSGKGLWNRVWMIKTQTIRSQILALFWSSPHMRMKIQEGKGEPGQIYHVRNVIGIENLITCGQMNKLVHTLLTELIWESFLAKRTGLDGLGWQ